MLMMNECGTFRLTGAFLLWPGVPELKTERRLRVLCIAHCVLVGGGPEKGADYLHVVAFTVCATHQDVRRSQFRVWSPSSAAHMCFCWSANGILGAAVARA